jgi:DNA-binding MarR family transcriptional regulator
MRRREASPTTRKAQARAAPERKEQPLGKVLDFMRLLWSLAHGLERRSKRMAVDLGVTGPQRLVIRILGRFPGVSAGELAEHLHLHPSTLTGVLARLEARGLIARRVDPQDRRRSLLRLTARGKRVDSTRKATVEGAVRAALAQSSSHDLEITIKMLRSLVTELDRLS